MELRHTIKRVLNEALGVPTNIIKVGKQIYGEILNIIPDGFTFDDLNNYEHPFYGDYVISDLNFSNAEVHFDLYPEPDIKLVSMGVKETSALNKELKLTSVSDDTPEFIFMMVFTAPETAHGSDIKEYIRNNSGEIISSITHELKHFYDRYKRPTISIKKFAKYQAVSENRFPDIDPINEFIFSLYYIHSIENLARPSELAAALENEGISKKDFLTFLGNHKTYKTLKRIANFSYDEMRSQLHDYIPKLKKFYDDINLDYSGMSDDQIVDAALRLVLVNLTNWQLSAATSALITSPFELLIGELFPPKQEFFRRYVKEVTKFGEDYDRYFRYEEKVFRTVARKVLRKIHKLFDLAKDVNESIINRELWEKHVAQKKNIKTKIEIPGGKPKSNG